jgi:outer membrane protein assembly factor BamB
MPAHDRKNHAAAESTCDLWRQCSVAAFLVATLGVTGNAEPRTFNDPTPTGGDLFGDSVALNGNYVLIGARGDDTLGNNDGQAHLFDVVTGGLLWTFNDPTPTDGDRFGDSVALDGNNVLIGARGDDTLGSFVGQAYLFDATTGNLLRTFNDPTVTEADQFGSSVALDGNNVLIGARSHRTQGVQVGQAHMFDAVTGGLLQTFNNPSPDDFGFGSAVALNGNSVLIGDPFDATLGVEVGQAHLFDAVTGNLLQTFNDPTPTPKLDDIDMGDRFGDSVALDGNHVLIGARFDDTLGEEVGQAHLFDATTGNLLRTFNIPAPTGFDRFGDSVALDGNNVLIGASRGDTAYLFDATTGNLLRTFNDPAVTATGYGGSVALHGYGVLIGDSGDRTFGSQRGQAYLFSVAPGDYDDNFDADGNDFLTWQRGESPMPLSQSDLDEWQANFGAIASAIAPVSATVPEPTTGLLLMLGVAVMMLTGSRTPGVETLVCMRQVIRSRFWERWSPLCTSLSCGGARPTHLTG